MNHPPHERMIEGLAVEDGTTSDSPAARRSLAPIVDVDQMAPTIRTILGDAGLEPMGPPTLDHVRHRTHKPHKDHRDWMSASWRCDVGGADTFVLLRARRDGGSRAEYDRWRRDNDTDAGVWHLPQLDATAWLFPNDPTLDQLGVLVDPGEVLALLGRLDVDVAGVGPEDLRVDVVHYYPEQRCTLRYRWRAPSDRRGRAVYLKAFRSTDHAIALDANCRAFRATRVEPAFVAPVPLGADTATSAVAFAEVPHTPLVDRIVGGTGADVLAECGRRLAGLHRTDLLVDRVITDRDQRAEIGDKLDKLTLAMPELAGLRRRIESALGPGTTGGTQPMTLTHGDFHLRQLGLADQDDPVLFDFDELAMADPARDIASFLVSLRCDPKTAGIDDLGRPFLAGYAEVDAVPASLGRQLRLQLATKAYRAFRAHRDDAAARAVGLLEAAATPDIADVFDLDLDLDLGLTTKEAS